MYLDRHQMKKPPLVLKLWALVVKTLTSLRLIGTESSPGHPMLYSYQGALPSQPVPSIRATLDRYLRVDSLDILNIARVVTPSGQRRFSAGS